MGTLRAFCKVGAEFLNMVPIRGEQIFHKARKHLKILGARKVILNKYHTGFPQTPGASLQNFVSPTKWHRDLCTPDLNDLGAK